MTQQLVKTARIPEDYEVVAFERGAAVGLYAALKARSAYAGTKYVAVRSTRTVAAGSMGLYAGLKLGFQAK